NYCRLIEAISSKSSYPINHQHQGSRQAFTMLEAGNDFFISSFNFSDINNLDL
ncbi:hypothetical protein LEMLEM_LOCUS18635, partial [Lemmus lemmus]